MWEENPRVSSDSVSTHLAISFNGVSWSDADFLALGVLQFLLGGGKAFSRDGPGNGVTSRFNRNIVEKSNGIIRELSTFNINYSDAGLFGIYGVTDSNRQLVESVLKEISSVYNSTIDTKELNRAKAQFKADILFNNQSQRSLLDFAGLHLLANDKVLTPTEYVKGIDSLTVEDVKRVAKRVFKSKPTLSAVGNISDVPTLEQITSGLQ